MATYALIRDDTGETLTLDAVLLYGEQRRSQWTEHELDDLSYAADGRIRMSPMITLRVVASPGTLTDGVTGGAARLVEVADFLERADADAATLTVQRPGRDPLSGLGLEDRPWTQVDTDAETYDLTLRQIRVVGSRLVGGTTGPVTAGGGTQPRADVADGLAAETEAGTRPLRSVLRTGSGR